MLIGERIAAGYRRVPPGEPDDWGDLGAGVDTSTEEVLHWLDAKPSRPSASHGRTAIRAPGRSISLRAATAER